jgi:hypothetical protein
MSSPNDEPSPEHKAKTKEYGRESRLSFKNIAESALRRELKDEAMEICKPQVHDFATCAQERGLMVIFSCKHLHRAVQSCLAEHNSEEKWQKYKVANKEEIARRARLGKA